MRLEGPMEWRQAARWALFDEALRKAFAAGLGGYVYAPYVPREVAAKIRVGPAPTSSYAAKQIREDWYGKLRVLGVVPKTND